MKIKLSILLSLISFGILICGCSYSRIDQRIRIVGIIDACKSNPQSCHEYLKQKVNNKEISEIVSFTIQECLKNE